MRGAIRGAKRDAASLKDAIVSTAMGYGVESGVWEEGRSTHKSIGVLLPSKPKLHRRLETADDQPTNQKRRDELDLSAEGHGLPGNLLRHVPSQIYEACYSARLSRHLLHHQHD